MKKIGFVLLIIGLIMVTWFGYEQWHSVQSEHTIDQNVTKAYDGGTKSKADESGQQKVSEKKATKQKPSDVKPSPIPDYKKGEQVAKLVIPVIKVSYDVFWGTSADTLKKGAGMYVSKWTVPPGYGGHTVISGHRDTVFRPLKVLKKGDMLYVSYQDVDYQYSINKIWITDPDDRTVIVKKPTPTLTLTTCYPFYYVGAAPNRYIIQAKLVKKGDLLKGGQLK